jgi:ABC-type lipoprotein export system ATPase subunit
MNPTMPEATPILRVRDLERRYATGETDFAALRGVSFEVDTGAFVALMGPSGCGKSTLLHLLGGMDRPTKGEIDLDGQRIDLLGEEDLARVRRRELGFVFQYFNLLPTLTLEENAALPLLLDGARRREALELSRALLARVGLEQRFRHYPAQLSGGELQRGAVARALVIRPKLVLADEPTGSLDSASGEAVLALLTELNRDLRVTFLIATHSPEVAEHCHRTIRLRDGRIETPDH